MTDEEWEQIKWEIEQAVADGRLKRITVTDKWGTYELLQGSITLSGGLLINYL